MTQTLEYLDFVLSIGSNTGTGQDYPISVSSPLGPTSATMTFPFDPATLQGHLKDLEIAVYQSASRLRGGPTLEEMTVPKLGASLFNALFSKNEVGALFQTNRTNAELNNKGLRIKLLVAAPEMAAVPWEYMYDPHRRNYITLSVYTPVVRYLDPPFPIQPQPVAPPLRILGMTASPRDIVELDLQRERQRLDDVIDPLKRQGLAELTWVPGQTWQDLRKALHRGPWHVFHFAGHGGFSTARNEGYVCFCNEQQNAKYVYATDLQNLLQDHRTLRLTVLNACEGARGGSHDAFSSTASILVNGGVPAAVLAMQYSISDEAAITLMSTFYESLVDGLPVDAALAEARQTVKATLPHSVEWGAPVLYTHARDGILFDLSPAFQNRSNSLDGSDVLTQPVAGLLRPVVAEVIADAAPGPLLGPTVQPLPAGPVPLSETSSPTDLSATTPGALSHRKHLEVELNELQKRYDVLSQRIEALAKDIGRETDSERLLTLKERLHEREIERQDIVNRMVAIQTQLQKTQDKNEQTRIFDAAMPSYGQVGRAMELIAMVRSESSGGLMEILQTTHEYQTHANDVRSKPFGVSFPIDEQGKTQKARLIVKVIANDFEPPMQQKRIMIPATGDSVPVPFQLVPQKAGDLSVHVELHERGIFLGTGILHTQAQVDGIPAATRRDFATMSISVHVKPRNKWTRVALAAVATVIAALLLLTTTDPWSAIRGRFSPAATPTLATVLVVSGPATPSPTSSPTATRFVGAAIVSEAPTRPPTATPTPIPPTSTPVVQATVSVARANLRAGPGTDYDILAQFEQGTVLTVLGKIADSSWYYVEARAGQTGWMAAPTLGVAPDARALPEMTPAITPRPTLAVTRTARPASASTVPPTATKPAATNTPTVRVVPPTATPQPPAPATEPTQAPTPSSEPTLAPAPTPVDTPTPAPPPG